MERHVEPGITLQDLGEHELKDIAGPIRLHQLVIEGLGSDFPALRTQPAAGNLPIPPTALVGRTGELAELRAYLVDGGPQLVTLTGSGGTGKTRLAVEVAFAAAHDFPDGSFFVPLAPVVDGPAMWAGIGQACGLPPEAHTAVGVTTGMRSRRALLVLDNLEQIDDADQVVQHLISNLPHARVLATSRRPLHILGEQEHGVPPLGLPGTTSTLAAARVAGAVDMFVRYAKRVRPGFELDEGNLREVVAICRALDGLPLAIELVSARAKMLTPAAILARLDRVLDLAALDRSRPDRQRTIRQTVDWSFRLLPLTHRHLLARMGVFAGGADQAAVEAVAASPGCGSGSAHIDVFDVLWDLVDASFVVVGEGPDGEPRFGLLETIRRFALDQLRARGELDAALAAHAQHYYDVAKQLKTWSASDFGRFWSTIHAERDNLREVIARRSEGMQDPDLRGGTVPRQYAAGYVAHQMLVARWYAEVIRQAGEVAADTADSMDYPGRLVLLRTLCMGHMYWGDSQRAVDVGMQVVSLADRVVHETPESDSDDFVARVRNWRIQALATVAASLVTLDRLSEARAFGERAILGCEPDGLTVSAEPGMFRDTKRYTFAIGAMLAQAEEDWPRVAELLASSQADVDADDVFQVTWHGVRMADVDWHLGRHQSAHERLRAALPRVLELLDPDLIVGTAEVLSIAAGDREPLLAAEMSGAIARYRAEHDLAVSLDTERQLRRDLAAAAVLVDEQVWSAAVAAGASTELPELGRRAVDVLDIG